MKSHVLAHDLGTTGNKATLFDGAGTVEPGTVMSFAATDAAPKVMRYWDFAFAETAPARDEAGMVDELDRLFTQAVNRQLVSDVPVGAYLSGGIDSGSIVAIAAKQLPLMSTFTVGFDLNSASGMELAFDERELALVGIRRSQVILAFGQQNGLAAQVIEALDDARRDHGLGQFDRITRQRG